MQPQGTLQPLGLELRVVDSPLLGRVFAELQAQMPLIFLMPLITEAPAAFGFDGTGQCIPCLMGKP